MKTIYLECAMGASGDMIMGALFSLLSPYQQNEFLHQILSLNIPGVEITAENIVSCGIVGTHMRVNINGAEEHEHGHHHDHSHSTPESIKLRIGSLSLPDMVKANANAVYDLIAQAESHAHNVPVNQIHFHEVGEIDAIVDIVACCLLIDIISPDQIYTSSVNVGGGQVKCAHGILPVPAPATEYLLRGVPIYSGTIKEELCTPTGAALLRHFTSSFGLMPEMILTSTGYGMGSKDFSQANCLRAFLGDTPETSNDIYELSCNIDDMTPEALGAAMDQLLENGATDVFFTAVQMKKNRPGVVLTCLVTPNEREKLTDLILLHTSTRGVREKLCQRTVMSYRIFTVNTPYGDIRLKISSGHGIQKCKPEYDDIIKCASLHKLPFGEIYASAINAFVHKF